MARQAASPVTITRYSANGDIDSVQVIDKPKRHYIPTGYTRDGRIIRLRIMALTETGEEIRIGTASTDKEADMFIASHCLNHPEHVSVWAEPIH